jgi:hypothetical protein
MPLSTADGDGRARSTEGRSEASSRISPGLRASVERRKGPYGIRTRAAAVRGRCPRPLDEWAARGAIVANGFRRRVATAAAQRSAAARWAQARAVALPRGRRFAPRSRGGSPRLWRGDRRSAVGVGGDARSGRSRPDRHGSGRTPPLRRAAEGGHRYASAKPLRTPITPSVARKPPGQTAVLQFADDSLPGSDLSTNASQSSPQPVGYHGLHCHGLQSLPEATKYR